MTEAPSGDRFLTMPGTTLMQLTVVQSGRLTPCMQRLRLTAPELASFGYLPGQDVMLMVDGDAGRPVRRRYTIRALDRSRQMLTLDIVRHADGPGERWVRAARPGVTVQGIGPRGKISPNPEADWHLFIADESGLAAVFSMAESLPSHGSATIILEVPDPDDHQQLDAVADVQLTWLHRFRKRLPGDPEALVEAARTVAIPAGRPHAYLIGEARVVLALRETLELRGFDADHMSPKAYWGRGKANANHGEPPREG
jgi:NADPH-dependent ferric siderophore reductase